MSERGFNHRTSLEERMFGYLTQMGIEFTEQYPTRSGFLLDFAILDKKIAIETDGNPWHTSRQQKTRDRFRDYMLKREGWIVIRFGEIFTLDDVKKKLTAAMPPA